MFPYTEKAMKLNEVKIRFLAMIAMMAAITVFFTFPMAVASVAMMLLVEQFKNGCELHF